MEINEQMDVEQLRQRMGDATTAEAEQMRNLLVLKGWETTDRIHERDWLSLLDQAAKMAK